MGAGEEGKEGDLARSRLPCSVPDSVQREEALPGCWESRFSQGTSS